MQEYASKYDSLHNASCIPIQKNLWTQPVLKYLHHYPIGAGEYYAFKGWDVMLPTKFFSHTANDLHRFTSIIQPEPNKSSKTCSNSTKSNPTPHLRQVLNDKINQHHNYDTHIKTKTKNIKKKKKKRKKEIPSPQPTPYTPHPNNHHHHRNN